MSFGMEWMMNRPSVMMRSGCATLEERFEMAITLDPTVGSRSKSYSSFRMPCFMEWMRNRYSMMMRFGRAMLE